MRAAHAMLLKPCRVLGSHGWCLAATPHTLQTIDARSGRGRASTGSWEKEEEEEKGPCAGGGGNEHQGTRPSHAAASLHLFQAPAMPAAYRERQRGRVRQAQRLHQALRRRRATWIWTCRLRRKRRRKRCVRGTDSAAFRCCVRIRGCMEFGSALQRCSHRPCSSARMHAPSFE